MDKNILTRHRGKRYSQNEFTPNQQMKGVIFFLYDKGFKKSEDAHDVIRAFCDFAGIKINGRKEILNACVQIQKNFPIFLKWFNGQYASSERVEQEQRYGF